MSKLNDLTVQVERGIALHKMIRLISFVLGGEGYLNFMGNEFGHPEWIDFPREGNNNSYDKCRRQWSLQDNHDLVYHDLAKFDKVMNSQESIFGSKISDHQHVSLAHEDKKLIIFEKGDLLFVFNFHHSDSYEDFEVGTNWASDHFILFETDEE